MTGCTKHDPCDYAHKLFLENERLRYTVQCLLQCQRLLLDSLGEWTMPTIPNN